MCDGAQMANFWRFLGPAFSASSVQHVSDLHLKFTLRPHHMCGSTVDIQSSAADTRGEEKRKKEDRANYGENIMSPSATQGGHKYNYCLKNFNV